MAASSPSDARRRRTVVGSALLACVAVLVTACNDDGRDLRPARPDQTASISTLAPTSSGPEFVLPDLDDDAASTSDPGATLPGEPTVSAPWTDGATIPLRHTCGGENLSPPVSWGRPPLGTVEIAVSLLDLDNPEFVHWVVAGIGPQVTALGEDEVPLGAVEATNGTGAIGYTGPCPPAGSTHTYLLTVHYLGQTSGAADGDAPDVMLARIRETVIATAEVVGTSTRA